MKCPKCKYNTFEFLDSCKKCGADLRSFKESLGIRPIILASRRESPPDEIATPLPGNATTFVADMEASADTFSWDAPQSPPSHETAGAVADEEFDSQTTAPEESFSFDTAFGDLPGFEGNVIEDIKENGGTTPSTTIGEFALEDFPRGEEIVDSPAETDTSRARADAFPPEEFDFLLENDSVAGQKHHQG